MSASKKPRISEPRRIRPELFDESHIIVMQRLWRLEVKNEIDKCMPVKLEGCDVEIIQSPFPVCLVRNLAPKEMIQAVIDEIPSVKFHEKSNDLYQFHQSEDVANLTNLKAIQELYDLICTEVLQWVENTLVPTGLKSEVAATFSCYANGGTFNYLITSEALNVIEFASKKAHAVYVASANGKINKLRK